MQGFRSGAIAVHLGAAVDSGNASRNLRRQSATTAGHAAHQRSGKIVSLSSSSRRSGSLGQLTLLLRLSRAQAVDLRLLLLCHGFVLRVLPAPLQSLLLCACFAQLGFLALAHHAQGFRVRHARIR
jgi:hypothetical protein